MIRTAQLIGKDWDDVWTMTALLFLNLLAYQKDRQEYEENERKKWQAKH